MFLIKGEKYESVKIFSLILEGSFVDYLDLKKNFIWFFYKKNYIWYFFVLDLFLVLVIIGEGIEEVFDWLVF